MAKNKQQEGKPVHSWRVAIQAITGPWTYTNLMAWVKLIALILVIRWAWFEPYKIPSGSMEPTLIGKPGFFQGDRVFVNKYYYGLRYPFMNKRIFEYKDPERWDVVVFKAAHENPQHNTLIKRIVALPGETVLIRDGGLIIDGEAVEIPDELKGDLYYTRYIGQLGDYILNIASGNIDIPAVNPRHENGSIFLKDIDMLRKRIALAGPNVPTMEEARKWLEDCNSMTFVVAEGWLKETGRAELPPFRYGIVDKPEFTKVPHGHYFLLGDNSPNSVDGRFFGWVPRDHLVGRTFCIWWPVAHWRDFTGFSHTWWGQALLWGLPGGLLLLAFVTHSIAQLIRVPQDTTIGGFRAGDRLLLVCSVYGIRAPFVSARMTKGRMPAEGETLLFRAEDGGHYLGIVTGGPGTRVPKTKRETVPEGSVLVEYDANGEGTAHATVEKRSIVGRVASVWWPLSRTRRLSTVRSTEGGE